MLFSSFVKTDLAVFWSSLTLCQQVSPQLLLALVFCGSTANERALVLYHVRLHMAFCTFISKLLSAALNLAPELQFIEDAFQHSVHFGRFPFERRFALGTLLVFQFAFALKAK